MIEIKGKYATAKVFIDEVDETTYSQIIQLVNHPTFTNPVRIMPDTHAGAANSVIGFTMKLGKSIIPNTVGVDIGCGMISAKLNLSHDFSDFQKLDEQIRKVIPVGNHNGTHKRAIINFERQFPFEKATEILWKFTSNFNKTYNTFHTPIEYNYSWFKKMCKRINVNERYIEQSIGTLGGGNHFIELGKSSVDASLWLTVHTGSRNLGKKVADYHSNIAKNNAKFDKKAFEKEFKTKREILKKDGKSEQIQDLRHELLKKYTPEKVSVPISMLPLTGEDMYNYFIDMIFAQTFASENRKLIVSQITKIAKIDIVEQIESVHNYIDFEDFVVRKGAIRAYNDEKMIIPFNMADGILICEGKSNEDWNNSAPHGAGRVLSRRQAKENINIDDYEKIMKQNGVFSTSVGYSTLDEAPQAYKNAEIIEKAISPTAEILFKLKPVYNLKGG